MVFEFFIIFGLFICTVKKKNMAICIFFVLVMFFLMTFSTFNADYYAYLGRYSRMNSFSDIFSSDVGFSLLMLTIKKLGLSFTFFLGVVCFIGLSIMMKVFYKYSNVPNLLVALYFVSFYYVHTVQLRAFISEWIVILAVLYYLKHEKPRSIIYAVMILIASLFHFIAIFYYALIIPKRVKKPKMVLVYTCLLTFVTPYLYRLFLRISNENTQYRMEFYTKYNESHVGLFSLIFVFLFIGLTFLTHRISHVSSQQEDSLLFSQITSFNLVTWISLGLIIIYSNNFYRINRPMIIISCMCLVEYFFKNSKWKKRDKQILATVGTISVYIVYEIITHTWFDSIMTNELYLRLK